uniref:Uncharacterized protein n=1 Tax=Falco tinnunculus TaxID=100819 RepID=A0A8C4TW71_FALTI
MGVNGHVVSSAWLSQPKKQFSLETSTSSRGLSAKISCLQRSLLAHSDWNIIVSVIFSYESHHRPVLLRVIGIKCDEFISTILIQSIHLDGILQSISKEKHFHLHWKKSRNATCKIKHTFCKIFLIKILNTYQKQFLKEKSEKAYTRASLVQYLNHIPLRYHAFNMKLFGPNKKKRYFIQRIPLPYCHKQVGMTFSCSCIHPVMSLNQTRMGFKQ